MFVIQNLNTVLNASLHFIVSLRDNERRSGKCFRLKYCYGRSTLL